MLTNQSKQAKSNHTNGKSPKTKQMANRCPEIHNTNGKTAPDVTSKSHQAWDTSPKQRLTNREKPPNWNSISPQNRKQQEALRCTSGDLPKCWWVSQHTRCPPPDPPIFSVSLSGRSGWHGQENKKVSSRGKRPWQLQRATSLLFSAIAWSSTVESQGRVEEGIHRAWTPS